MAVDRDIKEARNAIKRTGGVPVQRTIETPLGVYSIDQLPLVIRGVAVAWLFIFPGPRGESATFVGTKKKNK